MNAYVRACVHACVHVCMHPLHGAKHSPPAMPFSSPKGDPGGCRIYIPETHFFEVLDGQMNEFRILDSAIMHDCLH